MTDEIYRAIGRLEGKVDSISERQLKMDEKLDGVVKLADQTRGGLRTLLGVGSVAGAIGSAVTTLILKLKGGSG